MPAGRLTQRFSSKATPNIGRRSRGRFARSKFRSRKLTSRSNWAPKLKGPFYNSMGSTPFAMTKTSKLLYVDNYVFTTGALGVYGTEQVMRLNSIFDPDKTGGGHQPYGHDELATLYRKYKVNGVKVSLTFSNPSADNVVCSAVIMPQGGVYSLSGKGLTQVMEKPQAVSRILNATGSQATTISQYIPIHKALGISSLEHRAETLQYAANYGETPAAVPIIAFSVGSLQGTQSVTCYCSVRMEFYTTSFDRIIKDQS